MMNEQTHKMNRLQQNWQQHGIPEGAGRIGGASVGSNGRFAAIKSGALRDKFQKFNNFNTNNSPNSQPNGMPKVSGAGSMSFQAIPEPKVGRDKRYMNGKSNNVQKVEVAEFQAPKAAQGSKELSQIESLFGGGGSSYGGNNHVPQMGYNQNNEINLDSMYTQKGSDNFDPRSMILNRQQVAPQQNYINGYNSQPQSGYDPMDNQMMQSQYGNFAQPQQQHQDNPYMQHSLAAQQMNPTQQMEDIARNMTMQVLNEYKKQEKKNQVLTAVKHKSCDNLVKDFNGQHYIMSFNKENYMVLKPVKLVSK